MILLILIYRVIVGDRHMNMEISRIEGISAKQLRAICRYTAQH